MSSTPSAKRKADASSPPAAGQEGPKAKRKAEDEEVVVVSASSSLPLITSARPATLNPQATAAVGEDNSASRVVRKEEEDESRHAKGPVDHGVPQGQGWHPSQAAPALPAPSEAVYQNMGAQSGVKAMQLLRALQVASRQEERLALLRALGQQLALVTLDTEQADTFMAALATLPQLQVDERCALLPVLARLALLAPEEGRDRARKALKAALRDQSHRLRSAALRVLPSLLQGGELPLYAPLVKDATAALRDRDPRVRAQALAALAMCTAKAKSNEAAHAMAASAALGDAIASWPEVVALLHDVNGSVRGAAVQTVTSMGMAMPDAAVAAADSDAAQGPAAAAARAAEETQENSEAAPQRGTARLVDAAFALVCDAVSDLAYAVRVAAFCAMAELVGVHEPLLLQTFDKKLMSHFQMRKSAHDKLKERHGTKRRRASLLAAHQDSRALQPDISAAAIHMDMLDDDNGGDDSDMDGDDDDVNDSIDASKEGPATSAKVGRTEGEPSIVGVGALGDDMPAGDIDIHDVRLVATGACGAFVHGLEDEIAAVRSAAVRAIYSQAKRSPALAHEALDFLVDMFNDENDDVRKEAIATIASLAGHYVLQEEQLDAMLGILDDANTAIRRGMHALLGRITFKNHICLHVVIHYLLNNQSKYPADTYSIWEALAGLGRHHGALAEYLCRRLLNTSVHFENPEPDLNDATYVSVMVFLCNAASANPNISALVPGHFGSHRRFLSAALPALVKPRVEVAAPISLPHRRRTPTKVAQTSPATVMQWQRRASAWMDQLVACVHALQTDEKGGAIYPLFNSLASEMRSWLAAGSRLGAPSQKQTTGGFAASASYASHVLEWLECLATLLDAMDLSPAAVKLQRLLHATTRIRALFCCPGSALFSAQMSYLEIVACLACFAFSKKAESEFAECCISYLRVLHSMALELSQMLQVIPQPDKVEEQQFVYQQRASASMTKSINMLLQSFSELHKRGDMDALPQWSYTLLLGMGFDFLVAVPAVVKNRGDCVSQTAQQMRSPPKGRLDAVAGLSLGLPIKLDLLAAVPLDALRLEVVLPTGLRKLCTLPAMQALPATFQADEAHAIVSEGRCQVTLPTWLGPADVVINLVVAVHSTLLSGELLFSLASTRGITKGASVGTQPDLLSGKRADGRQPTSTPAEDTQLQHMRLIRGEFGQVVPYITVQNVATYNVSVSRPTALVQG